MTASLRRPMRHGSHGPKADFAGSDPALFYFGRDDLRDVLKHVLSRVTTSLYLNMIGFDDDELNDTIMQKAIDLAPPAAIRLSSRSNHPAARDAAKSP
jgi:hypothetical protein